MEQSWIHILGCEVSNGNRSILYRHWIQALPSPVLHSYPPLLPHCPDFGPLLWSWILQSCWRLKLEGQGSSFQTASVQKICVSRKYTKSTRDFTTWSLIFSAKECKTSTALAGWRVVRENRTARVASGLLNGWAMLSLVTSTSLHWGAGNHGLNLHFAALVDRRFAAKAPGRSFLLDKIQIISCNMICLSCNSPNRAPIKTWV